MKVNNENFDKVLNKLAASTRSPRGRFTAENSWKLLESRLLKRRNMKRFWMRTASAAAVVLLCVTSWAAYQFLYVAPQRKVVPAETVHTAEETKNNPWRTDIRPTTLGGNRPSTFRNIPHRYTH